MPGLGYHSFEFIDLVHESSVFFIRTKPVYGLNYRPVVPASVKKHDLTALGNWRMYR